MWDFIKIAYNMLICCFQHVSTNLSKILMKTTFILHKKKKKTVLPYSSVNYKINLFFNKSLIKLLIQSNLINLHLSLGEKWTYPFAPLKKSIKRPTCIGSLGSTTIYPLHWSPLIVVVGAKKEQWTWDTGNLRSK